MADFTNLKDNIKSKIKSNGKQEITGAVLQEQMIDIVDQMNETFTGEVIFDVNAYKGDYTPFTSRGYARAAAPYSKIGKKGLILKYLTTEGWVVEMQITDGYSSQDNGWATIYNGNDERMRNMATDMFGLVSLPLFQVVGKTLKIYDDFNVFSSTRVSQYKTIPAQEVALPNSVYWSACLVFDINNKQYETSLKVFSLIASNTFTNPTKEDGKLYIPILWCFSNKNKIESRQDIKSFYPIRSIAETSKMLTTNPYRGVCVPSGKINGVLVNIMDASADLSFYKFNLITKELTLIKTFPSSSLSGGVQELAFDEVVEVGGYNQIAFSGKLGYEFVDSTDLATFLYYPDSGTFEFGVDSTLLLGVAYKYSEMYDYSSDYAKLMKAIMMGESVNSIPIPTDINNCTSALSNVGYVGQFVGGGIKVASIDVNVRKTSEDIKVISYNTKTGEIVELKKVTPTSVGILNIPFDAPIALGELQILVHGGIGYKYDSANFGGNFNGANISYNYSGNGIYDCSKVNMIAWGIRYNMSESISLADYMQNLAIDVYSRLSVNSEVIIETINIQDYDNNLRKVFAAITPSEKHRYVVEIPEGTYDVASWFTSEEIANRSVGLQLANYTKLLGIGNRDKVILQWDNSNGTYNNDVSTLNTSSDWHELENLTILSNNVRYAVHDDSHYNGIRHIYCKNCRFLGIDSSRAWGAGTNYEYHGVFEDCRFDLQIVSGERSGMTYVESMCLHDYESHDNNHSSIDFINCRFTNPYDVTASGQSRDNAGIGFTHGTCKARFIGCKTDKYITIGNTCRATGYGNHFGEEPRVDNPISGIDYFDFL